MMGSSAYLNGTLPPNLPHLPAGLASDPDASVPLHHLCSRCLQICKTSQILNNAAWHRTSTLPSPSSPASKLPGAATNPAGAHHGSREAQLMRAMQQMGFSAPAGRGPPMLITGANNFGPTPRVGAEVVHKGKPGWVEGYFPESFLFHETIEGLKRAAVEEGCHLCTLFCAKIDEEGRTYLVDKRKGVPIWDVVRGKLRGRPFRIAISWECDFSEEDVYYRFALMDDCTDLGLKQEFARVKITGLHDTEHFDEPPSLQMPLVRSSLWTNAQSRLHLAAAWIQNCWSNHGSTCSLPSSAQDSRNPFTPHRLVDVGPKDGSVNPKLHVTEHGSESVPYLTLSHCWGPEPISYKLTSLTFNEMKVTIDTTKLDQNFRNAIEITRRLGFRYIWIDSLCIIQDSHEDWAAQSGVMGLIYTHSQCTIAALCAESSKEGFFKAHNPRCSTACRLPVKVGLNAAPFRKPPAAKRPLYSRAWVFQERLLSPRVLRFGHDQISWECQAALADEYMPLPLSHSDLTVYKDSDGAKDKKIREAVAAIFGAEQIKAQAGQDATIEKQPAVQRQFMKAWEKLVRAYSDLSLTYASDRFPAFAGITSVQQSRMGLTSLEGLWLENFMPNLLWYCKPKTGRRISEEIKILRPERKEFPEALYVAKTTVNSLSWAAIEGEVEYSDWPEWDFARDNFSPEPDTSSQAANEHTKTPQRVTKPRQVLAGEEATNSPVKEISLLRLHERKHAFRLQHYDASKRIDADDQLFGRSSFAGTRVAHQAKIRANANVRRLTSLLRVYLPDPLARPAGPSAFVLRGPVFRFESGPLEKSLHTSWALPGYFPPKLLDHTNKDRWFYPDLEMMYDLPIGTRVEVTCLAVIQWEDNWASKPEGHVAGVVLVRLLDHGGVDEEMLSRFGREDGAVFVRVGFFDLQGEFGVVSDEIMKFAEVETVTVV